MFLARPLGINPAMNAVALIPCEGMRGLKNANHDLSATMNGVMPR
ncbi:hypothetical protein [Komagataeibacter swingsii]|nr:hypothetical protein [Komagataeibacter swingsii]